MRMFDHRQSKASYVGIVYIFDLKSKKVLLEGGGYFDVINSKLDVLFDCSEIYKDVEWVPVLQTEDGYFCPAQTTVGHLIGFGIFSFDHRNKFNMSSYFHWPKEKGINHITKSFDSIVIDVSGVHGNQSLAKYSKDWSDIEIVTKGISKDIDEATYNGLKVLIKTHAHAGRAIEQRVSFGITPLAKITRESWLPLVHAFRLYWLFQHDRTDCQTFNFAMGDSLTLVTDMMQLRGYDDNTEVVAKALPIEQPMNAELLAKTIDYFTNNAKNTENGGIEFAFYRLLGFRFGNGTKRVGDDLLDLVFALDGFCADINKTSQRKFSKAEKASIRASIRKILEEVERNKDELDRRVYDFYSANEDDIFNNITHKPYIESVQQCFETLGMDYDEHAETIVSVNKIRQIFVHGKGYDTRNLVEKIYTHGTTTLEESTAGTQVVFGQATGLSDSYYLMIRQLFRQYFSKEW